MHGHSKVMTFKSGAGPAMVSLTVGKPCGRQLYGSNERDKYEYSREN